MIPLNKTPGLAAEDILVLERNGIHSADDFWTRMAINSKLVDELFGNDEAAKRRIVEALSKVAQKEAEKIERPILRGHWPDLLLILVIIALGYGIFRDRTPAPQRKARQVVVAAPNGLAPFHVITASDVGLEETPTQPSALTSPDAAVGRYTEEYIPKGAVMEESKLSSGPRLGNELTCRRILRVIAKPTTVILGIKPPRRVGLMASPRIAARQSGVLLFDVYLLQADPLTEGISAVVALRTSDAKQLTPLLGFSDLFIVGAVR